MMMRAQPMCIIQTFIPDNKSRAWWYVAPCETIFQVSFAAINPWLLLRVNSSANGRPNSTGIFFLKNYVENWITLQCKIIFHELYRKQNNSTVLKMNWWKLIFHEICGKLNSTQSMESKFPLEFSVPGVDEFTLIIVVLQHFINTIVILLFIVWHIPQKCFHIHQSKHNFDLHVHWANKAEKHEEESKAIYIIMNVVVKWLLTSLLPQMPLVDWQALEAVN